MGDIQKVKKTNKWLGLFVLILIIGPVIGMFNFLTRGFIGLAVSMFGLYFCIFGLLAMINSHKEDTKIIQFIFILVGLIIIAIGIVNQFGTKQIIEFINTNGISFLFALFCISIGIGMIIGPDIYEQRKLKRCKKDIVAECVDVNIEYHHRGRIGASPVWKYIINGKEYTYCNEMYFVMIKDTYEEYRNQIIGTTNELFVNPRNPNDAYVKISDEFKKISAFIGVGCLIGAGIIIFTFF